MKKDSSAQGIEERFARGLPVVDSMGQLIFDPVYSQKDHTTPCCEMFHVIKGRVTLISGRGRVEAVSGDTLLVPTGEWHRDDFDASEGLEVFMVFFSWNEERAFFSRVTNARLRRLPLAAKSEISRMFNHLRMDRAADDDFHRLFVRSQILSLLLYLLRECSMGGRKAARSAGSPVAVRRQGLMLRAKSYIEAHYSEPLALDDIARELKVSPFHLSHVFSRESDFSLFEYLTGLRMNRAKELLSAGSMNVAEAARAVGYENCRYFAKIFRQRFGHAPIGTPARESDPFFIRAKEYPK